MINKSLWDLDLKNKYPSIKNNEKCDVLIIGGGLTGINTAYFLKDSKLNVKVVEKKVIGSGITARSTAKITYLQEDIYSKIMKYQSNRKARIYLQSQLHGINLLKSIIDINNIDCDLAYSPSFLFTKEENNINKVKRIEKFLNKNGIKTTLAQKLPNNVSIKYGFSVSNCYTFNPIKYLNEVANIIDDKIEIFENTRVTNIKKNQDEYMVSANGFEITCKKLVIATNYPFFILPYLFPLKSTLEKSYIKASKSEALNFNAINLDNNIESYRYYKDEFTTYEIRLGGTHELYTNNNEEINYKKIEYENSNYFWSNRDVITKDYLPYIGKIKKNVYIGTGYSTWGMINSCLAGELISQMIERKSANYKDLFNPKRVMGVWSLVRYPELIGKMSYSYIKGKIKPMKPWYNMIKYKKIGNTKIFQYIDKDKHTHTVHANCPHMGCRLIFNEVDQNWECPCHGSTFDLDGKSIDGPSNKDISV